MVVGETVCCTLLSSEAEEYEENEEQLVKPESEEEPNREAVRCDFSGDVGSLESESFGCMGVGRIGLGREEEGGEVGCTLVLLEEEDLYTFMLFRRGRGRRGRGRGGEGWYGRRER